MTTKLNIKKFGNKIPHKYFYTKGSGESNYGGKGLPYEAGSYDAALNKARIEQCNMMFYTSLLPPTSKEITRAQGIKTIKWGNVMDSIMAVMNGTKGQTITASIMVTQLYDPKATFMGSFACEYAGYGSETEALETLIHDIDEMIERRGWGVPKNVTKLYKLNQTSKGYKFKPARFHSKTLKIKKRFGTALSAICFTEYSGDTH